MISVAKKRRPGQTTPEYRFCADLRVLNNKVLADSLFTGSVPANLALLEKHNIYSALDMFNAFESCQLEPDSRDFFAFSSPSGQQFRYKRLPQGFCNSPAIMSCLTSELLANLPTSSREAKLGQLAADTPSGLAGEVVPIWGPCWYCLSVGCGVSGEKICRVHLVPCRLFCRYCPLVS